MGSDTFGNHVIDYLKKIGVETTHLTQGKNRTGTVNCFITQQERTFHSFFGASIELGTDDIKSEQFQGDHTHIEGYALFFEQVMEKSLEFAKENKTTISIDLSDVSVIKLFRERLTECLKKVDYVFGNFQDYQALTGKEKPNEIAQCFEKRQLVVITNGADKCYIKPADSFSILSIPACKVDTVVDPTGAGDHFLALFLHQLKQGKMLTQCAEIAHFAASQVIQNLGAVLTETQIMRIQEKI